MQKSLFTLCFALLLYQSSIQAQNLSVERYAPLVTRVGDKVLFGNGQQYGGKFTDRVDVYDNSTGTWSTHDLVGQKPYAPSVVAGDKVVYYPKGVAGDQLDIYDAATRTWSVQLAPEVVQLDAVLVAGNNIVFAGGKPNVVTSGVYIFNASTGKWTVKIIKQEFPYIGRILNKIMVVGGFDFFNSQPVNLVHIYDLDQETWSDTTLSAARRPTNPAVIGNKIIFAGGRIYAGNDEGTTEVDIYDAVANTWSLDTLPGPIGACNTAVIGTKALFVVSATPKNMAYLYNAVNGTWSARELSHEAYDFNVSTAGDKVLIAGGFDYDPSIDSNVFFNTVDIFDAGNDTWHTHELSVGRIPDNVVVQDGKVIYLGGDIVYYISSYKDLNKVTQAIDIYDSALDQWSTYSSENANFAFGTTGSKLYLAGGKTLLPNGLSKPSGKVDVFDFSSGHWSSQPIQIPRTGLSMAALPDKVLIAGGRTEAAPGFFHKATPSVEVLHD